MLLDSTKFEEYHNKVLLGGVFYNYNKNKNYKS
jgi:hypothetical protein